MSSPPPIYDCRRTARPPRLDGRLTPDPHGWDCAPWMSDYGDILGGAPRPRYTTQSKMLYDDRFLYVGAYLSDPNVWGTLTADQVPIFHDNDFEIFLDPGGRGENYYEFEINALGATWQLTLDRPYSAGGTARDVRLDGLVSAVHVLGSVNDPASAPDEGWSVTVALPLAGLARFGGGAIEAGVSVWRENFSRVQWEHRVVEGADGQARYERVPPHGTPLPQGSNEAHPECNWTWAPRKEVTMHAPETWGFINFV